MNSGPQLLEPVERPMRRLFRYLRPMRGRLAYSVVSAIANKVLDLMPPLMVAWFVAVVTNERIGWLESLAGSTDEKAQLVALGVLVVVVFAGESITQWMADFGFQTLAQNLQHVLRVDAYGRMQQRELRFFEEHRLGRTLAVLNDDVNQLERFLNTGFKEIVNLVVLFAFAGVVLLREDVALGLVAMAPVPLIIWGSVRFSKLLEPRYAHVREAVGALASRLENNIAGILVIKSFTAEPYETGRVREASDDYRRLNTAAIKLSTVFVPLIRMAIALGFAVSLVVAGFWVLDGRLRPSVIVLFGMMVQRMLWPLTRLGSVLDEFQRAAASAARVFGLLDTPARVQDPAQPVPLREVAGEVHFDHVRFDYREGERVLQGLDFTIAPGETVGVAGPTGAGKSTLIKLLLRLYDVDAGAVRIDGHDVREVRQHDLRRHVAVVTQDVYLFHGTIAENIAYGQSTGDTAAPSRADVEAAARSAHLHDFVASLPGGYDTMVGERGIKLSGGQRQRLSLARALLKGAPILVLDEATSSVDTETEREIQENLAAMTSGHTAIIVAHRLSTIRHADRILVLDGGRVAEEGTHEELVGQGGLYADLWNVQSGNVRTATG